MAALQALPLSLFAQNTGEKPNILYIMCDDHAGCQAISAYGSPSLTGAHPKISTDLQKGMKIQRGFPLKTRFHTSRTCLMTGPTVIRTDSACWQRASIPPKPSSLKCCRRQLRDGSSGKKRHMSCRPKRVSILSHPQRPGTIFTTRPSHQQTITENTSRNGICHRPHHRPCHRIPRPKRQ